ncbi:EamA family transporter [Flavihumibacter profundi]|uniref:EamA family transporter n=1 Tax=Flavihumibacter profundi TaxID=2716883 RepID=UPI001CC67641|nr:EamA family transporter [Flavihumibacter profundi]MBZ5859539.1 EamA family transporter [Flavihumibacter profundi]
MSVQLKKGASPAMVILAFAIVYIVWGSTYFFIQRGVKEIPPFIMGAMRFILSGSILMGWCMYKGERIWDQGQVKAAAISGLILLLVGNGAVIWAEKTLPSSLVAILSSVTPIWFVILDRPKWTENFQSKSTLIGLFIGFIGVYLLFSEQVASVMKGSGHSLQIISLMVLMVGSISWARGSLYAKYHSKGSATVSSAWQMLVAGLAFLPLSAISREWGNFHTSNVSSGAWLSILYLVFMGSLAGYSAYIWLLQVRPATQVSTNAYVNPVVAVLLGTMFAGEHMSGLQILGLAVILTSVLLINLAKYRSAKAESAAMQIR